MAGLIENSMSNVATKPMLGSDTMAQAGSVGIDPEKRSVDAAKETVSGQLDALLKTGSPYLDRARAGAAVTANQRGLLNSSMAAGAGEAAAIDAALPIANADAGIYGQASRDNQGVSNAALQFNADSSNKASQFNADAANKPSLLKLDASNQMALQSLKGDQATTLANIEANYKTLIQASASAGQFFTSQTNNIAAVMADPNTTPEQKQLAVDKLTQIMQSGLTVIGGISNLNLAGLLDFTGTNTALNSPSVPPTPEPTPAPAEPPIRDSVD